MNRFLIYILPFLGALMFSCSQQNEASYVEEAEEVEMTPAEEKANQQATYYWETSEVEVQINQEVVDGESTNNEVLDTQGLLNIVNDDEELSIEKGSAAYTPNGNNETPGSMDKDQSESSFITKEKVLKAFVKTNIEDVLDLLTIYNDASQDKEMSEVARRAIEDYLKGPTFEELNAILEEDKIKKLKLSAITQDKEGAYVGAVDVKGVDRNLSLDYQIFSTETEFGISRKFQIVGIN